MRTTNTNGELELVAVVPLSMEWPPALRPSLLKEVHGRHRAVRPHQVQRALGSGLGASGHPAQVEGQGP